MNNKKIVFFIIFTILVFWIVVINIYTKDDTSKVINENLEKNEIKPEEEIAIKDEYNTEIELYFVDKTSDVISKEIRRIDARELIDNPYKYVINLLMEGPKDENLYNPIPKGTQVNSVILKKNTLYLDFNEEFLNSNDTDSIYIILNTMYQFNEIESIKITIDGEERDGIRDKFVKTE